MPLTIGEAARGPRGKEAREPLWNLDGDALYEPVARRLAEAVRGPLPGVEAQLAMAPSPRPGWTPGHFPGDCRRGAALLLVYPGADGRASVVLTARARDLARHSGQVSLPGGRIDTGEGVRDAALREAREEVGVDEDACAVLGELTPLHIPASGFVLHPVLATADGRPAFRRCDREVAEIIETAVVDLADPANVARETMERPGGLLEVPFFAVSGRRVWGATAMVLSEFLHLL